MSFCRSKLKLGVATALFAASGFIGFAQGQQDGQPIIFSRPTDGGTIAPPAASDASQPIPNTAVTAHDITGGNSISIFGNDPVPHMPLPPPTANARRPNSQKNWALMTPEQIMGLQTPEQMLGLPDKNAGVSPEEQFLNRQRATTMAQMSNGMRLNNWNSKADDSNPFGWNRQNQNNSFLQSGDRPDAGNAKNFSSLFGAPKASIFDQDQNNNTHWVGIFSQPDVQKKNDPDQIAEMERFRALLGDNPTPESSTTPLLKPTLENNSAVSSLAQFDPFGHPLVNPANDPSKPAGLTPLPQVTGYYEAPKKAQKPSWEAQNPPWMNNGSGLNQPSSLSSTPPVRKFY